MKKITVLACLIATSASAATLEDVKIVNINPGKNNIELTIQTKNASSGTFFIVDVTRGDVDSIEKLGLVFMKVMNRNKFKLNLDIPSFSASPSGSYYRSECVTFIGIETEN